MGNWRELDPDRAEWTIEEAREKIAGYEHFYHSIDLGDGLLIGQGDTGELGVGKWDFIIKRSLPDVEGKRVLDAGCCAGVYSIMCCRSGAREVVGVELSDEKYDQAVFIKSYLGWKEKKEYPITYIHDNLWNALETDLGEFDLCIAGNIVYHMKTRAVEFLGKLRDRGKRLLISGYKTTPGGTAADLRDAMERAGWLVTSVEDIEGYISPVLTGERVEDFKFEIMEVDVNDLWFEGERFVESPWVDLLKQWLANPLIKFEDTKAWGLVAAHHVRESYTYSQILDDPISKAVVVATKNCQSFVDIYNSVKDLGYPGTGYEYNYVPVIFQGGRPVMIEGRHRVAALTALGYEKIKVCKLFEEDKGKYDRLFGEQKLARQLERMSIRE
ncbi:MAG: hypothetical protein A2Y38_04185 [Spirochaetes bacterium GWB1_59_5]|nr:MAG: hypothetical protein A2Y38_04185 [Spirochaetes bacterium GWB1_59_5]